MQTNQLAKRLVLDLISGYSQYGLRSNSSWFSDGYIYSHF